ncbi:uncharacterized protein [Channa argus]
MAVAQGPLIVAVLLLVSSGLHCFSLPAACPESCTCQRAPVLNCSSSGLSLVPQHIQDSVTELDLSHNFLSSVTLHRSHHNLRNVWLGNNTITHLSLCIEKRLGSQFVRDIQPHRLRPWSRGCVSWAPTLQLLSVERNQLEQLPEGLQSSGSLKVLQLSFNRISSLRPADLSHLRQLKELHLQHNLIASLHSQMFQDLAQLTVLDLSFNMLTSIHPFMYLSLNTIGADVRLDGNRWQCDCRMRNLRRRMAYDSSRGLQTWSIVCASPSILSGNDLLQLEEDDLNCFNAENKPELHQDVTINSGSEILLSCSTQDSLWWTPTSQSSVNQPQAGLLISDFKERDTGLYVCVSEEQEVVSIFNLQISKIIGTRRHKRSLARNSRQIISQDTANRVGQGRNVNPSQSDLTLAVCLSVFITFLVAFILGVLARPCIDVLWKKVTKKKRSAAANSVSSTDQREYDNEAFSSGEQPGEIPTYRERRVTFSHVDFREDNNVIYYDTVASDKQESINNQAVIEEVTRKAGDSEVKNNLRQTITEDIQKNCRGPSDITNADPAELEERRSLSSSSDSSLSNKVLKEDQMTQGHCTKPRSSQLVEDSVQQRPNFSAVPQILVESRIPGFASEPFAEWSPHSYPADLDQENEEPFEFSDSARSASSSMFGSFNNVAAIPDKQKREDMSSSSSYVSDDEPTQYTVNSDQEEEKVATRDKVTLDHTKRHLDIRAPSRSSDSSSSTDGEVETTYHTDRPGNVGIAELPCHESPTVSNLSKTQFPPIDLEHVPHIKRCLDIKAPSLDFISSSSSESEDEATYHTDRPGKVVVQQSESHDKNTRWPLLDLENVPCINMRLDIKAPSPAPDSHSSCDSEDETTHCRERPVKVNIVELPLQKSQTSDNPEARWPVVDLGNITRIKRRLDIKGPSPPPDSSLSGGSRMDTMEANKMSPYYSSSISDEQEDDKVPSLSPDLCTSSDSEDETTGHTERQRTEMVLYKEPKTVGHEPDARWPALDLQHIPHIKRRLDIKAPSPAPDSSFSIEIAEEVHITKPPFKESEAEGNDLETRWPALDLEKTIPIKRRLDIKASSPASDSSSHSDSEDETTGHTERQRTEMVNILYKEPKTVSHEPDARWPALDLQHIPHIKRRLDIKAPSPAPDLSFSIEIESEAEGDDLETRWPALDLKKTTPIKRRLDIKVSTPASDSSSHCDSEDETTHHKKKQEQGEIHIARPPGTTSQTYDQETQWPVLDLEHATHIKRRLDIKAPSRDSASSDNENETTNCTETQTPLKADITELPLNDPDPRWPALDLDHLLHIKTRLDIKAPTPIVSSSSSESDDEMTYRIKREEQGAINTAWLPVTTSQTHETETQWPDLDLEQTIRIKRRLDIQASSPASNSSFSSDSDHEIADHTGKQRPAKLDTADIPLNDPETRWPALDLEHLPHIKRRLDIKSGYPDVSSNIKIVEDKQTQIKKHEQREDYITKLPFQESKTERNDQETKWPTLDLEHSIHIKRRLDIKAPSRDPDSSSRSDSEDETFNYTEKQRPGVIEIVGLPMQESQIVRHDPETRWPAHDGEHSTSIKRHLDIKAPSPASDSSSSSDCDYETAHYTETPIKGNAVELHLQKSEKSDDPEARWPAVDLGNITHIKRRLDIKGPSPPPDSLGGSSMVHTIEEKQELFSPYYSSSSSDEQEEAMENLNRFPIKVVPDTEPRLPELSIRSSDTPMFRISHTPKTDHNIKLEKYTIITGEMAEIPTSDSSNTTQDINPELQSRWATMNLGMSRFRKRLEITSHRSPSSVRSETDGKGWRGTSQLPVVTVKEPSQNTISRSETEEVERIARVELNSETSEVVVESDLVWPHLDLTNIPIVKRALDIKAPVRAESSSSSNSEDETIHQSVPDLSLGVPRVKRRLNIKAPTPDHSNSPSSCSENENDVTKYPAKGSTYASNMSGVTDNDSIITYKRLIMKTTDKSPTIHHAEMVTVAQEGSSQADRKTSLVPRKLLSISFDGVVKKKTDQSRRIADADLPPEIRWTGIGRHLSDLPSSKRCLDVESSSLQPSLPAQPQCDPNDSFNISSIKSYNNLKLDRGREYVTPVSSYSALSANSVSLASSRALDHFDNSTVNTSKILSVLSEERRERKGLNALKAMSSERQKWDKEDKHFNSGSSLYHHPHGDSYEEEIKPLAKQPLTHLSSTSLVGRRAADVLYDIPSYRRHGAGDIKPPQEVPPPVPETPPPDEEVELTWTP